jgi:hypothetical protein
VRDVVKFEMLIAAGAMEGLIYYLVNFVPSAIPGKNDLSTLEVKSCLPVQQVNAVRSKSKDDEKRLREEQIRCESDLKRVYIYASRAIQTQDQTNLNRYALVKGKPDGETCLFNGRSLFEAGLELFAQHSTRFTEYLYDDYPDILRCLRTWNAHDNYDVKKIAQRAYDTFLLGVKHVPIEHRQ